MSGVFIIHLTVDVNIILCRSSVAPENAFYMG